MQQYKQHTMIFSLGVARFYLERLRLVPVRAWFQRH